MREQYKEREQEALRELGVRGVLTDTPEAPVCISLLNCDLCKKRIKRSHTDSGSITCWRCALVLRPILVLQRLAMVCLMMVMLMGVASALHYFDGENEIYENNKVRLNISPSTINIPNGNIPLDWQVLELTVLAPEYTGTLRGGFVFNGTPSQFAIELWKNQSYNVNVPVMGWGNVSRKYYDVDEYTSLTYKPACEIGEDNAYNDKYYNVSINGTVYGACIAKAEVLNSTTIKAIWTTWTKIGEQEETHYEMRWVNVRDKMGTYTYDSVVLDGLNLTGMVLIGHAQGIEIYPGKRIKFRIKWAGHPLSYEDGEFSKWVAVAYAENGEGGMCWKTDTCDWHGWVDPGGYNNSFALDHMIMGVNNDTIDHIYEPFILNLTEDYAYFQDANCHDLFVVANISGTEVFYPHWNVSGSPNVSNWTPCGPGGVYVITMFNNSANTTEELNIGRVYLSGATPIVQPEFGLWFDGMDVDDRGWNISAGGRIDTTEGVLNLTIFGANDQHAKVRILQNNTHLAGVIGNTTGQAFGEYSVRATSNFQNCSGVSALIYRSSTGNMQLTTYNSACTGAGASLLNSTSTVYRNDGQMWHFRVWDNTQGLYVQTNTTPNMTGAINATHHWIGDWLIIHTGDTADQNFTTDWLTAVHWENDKELYSRMYTTEGVYTLAPLDSPSIMLVTIIAPTNTTYISSSVLSNFTVTGPEEEYTCWRSIDYVETALGTIANNTATTGMLAGLNIGPHFLNITCMNSTLSNFSSTVSFTVLPLDSLSNHSEPVVYETNSTISRIGMEVLDSVAGVAATAYLNGTAYAATCTNVSQVYNCTVNITYPLLATGANNSMYAFVFEINLTMVNGSLYYYGNLTEVEQRSYFAYVMMNVSLPGVSFYEAEIVLANGTVQSRVTTANRTLYFTFNYSDDVNAVLVAAGLYQQNVTLPTVDVNSSHAIRAHYNVSFNGDSRLMNSTPLVFEILNLSASNCSGGGFPILLYLLQDEVNNSMVNGSQTVTLTLYNPTRTLGVNVSLSNYSGFSLSVCVPAATPLLVDSVHMYYTATHPMRYHYLLNESVNPGAGSQDVPLYLLAPDRATAVVFTVQDQNAQAEAGVYIVAERYYPAENTYRPVAMGRTDDEGLVAIYLETLSPTYRFRVYKDFNIAKTTVDAIISCVAAPCSISIVLGTGRLSEYLNWKNGITWDCVYTNTTQLLNCTFTDITETDRSFRLVVYESTRIRTETLCDESLTATSGSLSCSGLEVGSRYNWEFSQQASPPILLDSGVIYQRILRDLGVFGRYLGLLLFLGIVFMGVIIPDTFLAGLFTIFAVIVLSWLELIVMSELTVMGLIIVGVILAMKAAASRGVYG